jgi:endonuclease-3 related protein
MLNYKKFVAEFFEDLKKSNPCFQKQWVLWRKRIKSSQEKELVVISAVLAQRTKWCNVEKSLLNLKKAKLDSLKRIASASKSSKIKNRLQEAIKPSGFYKQKTEYLIELACFILDNYKGINFLEKQPLNYLRSSFLQLRGIGRETADSILLYGLSKPVFVIDEYTKRFLKERKILISNNYEDLRNFFEQNLRKDWRLYQDFHALIVMYGQSMAKRNSKK